MQHKQDDVAYAKCAGAIRITRTGVCVKLRILPVKFWYNEQGILTQD